MFNCRLEKGIVFVVQHIAWDIFAPLWTSDCWTTISGCSAQVLLIMKNLLDSLLSPFKVFLNLFCGFHPISKVGPSAF